MFKRGQDGFDILFPFISETGWWRWSGRRGGKESHCPQLVKERSEIKKREFGEGRGRVLGVGGICFFLRIISRLKEQQKEKQKELK